jgi:hypothetical protein
VKLLKKKSDRGNSNANLLRRDLKKTWKQLVSRKSRMKKLPFSWLPEKLKNSELLVRTQDLLLSTGISMKLISLVKSREMIREILLSNWIKLELQKPVTILRDSPSATRAIALTSLLATLFTTLSSLRCSRLDLSMSVVTCQLPSILRSTISIHLNYKAPLSSQISTILTPSRKLSKLENS